MADSVPRTSAPKRFRHGVLRSRRTQFRNGRSRHDRGGALHPSSGQAHAASWQRTISQTRTSRAAASGCGRSPASRTPALLQPAPSHHCSARWSRRLPVSSSDFGHLGMLGCGDAVDLRGVKNSVRPQHRDEPLLAVAGSAILHREFLKKNTVVPRPPFRTCHPRAQRYARTSLGRDSACSPTDRDLRNAGDAAEPRPAKPIGWRRHDAVPA